MLRESSVELIHTQDESVIVEFLKKDPTLYKAITDDPDTFGCRHYDMCPDSSMVLLFKKDDNILGFTHIHDYTNAAVFLHFNLGSHWWGKEVTSECQAAIDRFLLENTSIRKIQANCPAESAAQVISSSAKYGYEVEGRMKNAIIYHGVLQDAIILGKRL